MGEIAEMMLDGTLCQGCGEYMGGGLGFPGFCRACEPSARKPRNRDKKATRIAQAQAAPIGKKRLRWLREASYENNGGLYPGARADLAPGVFRDLEKLGWVRLYTPHNPAHKDRYVITEAGREALARAGAPQ